MSQHSERDESSEVTNTGSHPLRRAEDIVASISDRSPVQLGLVITICLLLVAGVGQASVAFSRIADLAERMAKQESITIDRGVQGQRSDDKLDHVKEAVDELRADVKDLKSEFRGRR